MIHYWQFTQSRSMCHHVCVCVCAQSCPILCNPMDCSSQAPLSMGFPRQEYWSGLPFPSPGHLPDPGIEPASPMSAALVGGCFTTEPMWKRVWSWPLTRSRRNVIFYGVVLLILGECCCLWLSRHFCHWGRFGQCAMQIHNAQERRVRRPKSKEIF